MTKQYFRERPRVSGSTLPDSERFEPYYDVIELGHAWMFSLGVSTQTLVFGKLLKVESLLNIPI